MSSSMKKVIGIILGFIAFPALSTDITCPKEFPRDIEAEGVSVEWHPHGQQKFANVFIPREYKGEELYDVFLDVGSHEYDAKGKKIETPIIGVSLKIRELKNRPMVQVFVSKEAPKIKLSIQYGEFCGYSMNYKITHNKASKKTQNKKRVF